MLSGFSSHAALTFGTRLVLVQFECQRFYRAKLHQTFGLGLSFLVNSP